MAGPSSPSDVSKLAIPLLYGPLVNWALYGVLCVQIYVYSYNFPDDKRALKLLAYFVFLLETVQTALTGADLHYWFINGFGNEEQMKDSHFAPIDIAIMHSVISLIVQEYFCYRIWRLNRRLSWFCVIIAILAIVQSVGAAWGGIVSVIVGKYAVSRTALYLWSLPSAVVDILIAIAMTVLLRQARRLDEQSFPNYILLRVVRLTIETNTLTASVAIASFVLYVAFPDNIYYAFTGGIIGKLYSNTLLVSLNNRIYFRDHSFPGGSENAHYYVDDSSRSYPSAISSLTFARPVLRHSHTAPIGDRLTGRPNSGSISSAKVINIGKLESTVIEGSIVASHS